MSSMQSSVLGRLGVKAVAGVNRFAPWLLAFALSVLAWQLSHLFWLIIDPPRVAQSTGQVPMPVVEVPPNINGFQLFAPTPVLQSQAVDANQNMNIPMTLEGVFINKGGLSAALVKVNDKSRHYRVGQLLEGTQIQLAFVGWNYVELRTTSGEKSKLKFGATSAEPLNAAPATPGAVAEPAVGINSFQGGFPGAMGAASQFMGGSASNAERNKAAVTQMLTQASIMLRDSPAGYLSQMGLTPTSNGYQITSGAPTQYLSKMGLQAGDRVVSVNGHTVGEVQQDSALLNEIKQQGRADIVIARGSQTLTIQQSW